jgi:hypothetical protein
VKEDYLVTAACYIEWNGLAAGHGYIVKNVYTFKRSDGSETHILKMRNPFKIPDGQQPWTGKYSANDFHFSPELKKHVDFDNLQPGEFFMTIDDFKQGFKYYTITYMHRLWKNSFIEKRSAVSNRLYKFNFTVGDIEVSTAKATSKEFDGHF